MTDFDNAKKEWIEHIMYIYDYTQDVFLNECTEFMEKILDIINLPMNSNVKVTQIYDLLSEVTFYANMVRKYKFGKAALEAFDRKVEQIKKENPPKYVNTRNSQKN